MLIVIPTVSCKVQFIVAAVEIKVGTSEAKGKGCESLEDYEAADDSMTYLIPIVLQPAPKDRASRLPRTRREHLEAWNSRIHGCQKNGPPLVCCIFLKLCCKHNTLVDAQRGHTLARLNNGLLDDKKMPFLYMSH